MSATSIDWLLWMAGTVALYWLAPARWRDGLLIALSALFMAVYDPLSAVILAVFTTATYWLARPEPLPGRRTILIGSAIVAVLAFFKVAAGLRHEGADEAGFLADVAIPLGLSYYAFRCLHYLIERYKGTLPAHGFADFVAYLCFLPTFIAGPIHRFPAHVRDRHAKEWSASNLSEGMERILYGYVRIVVLGNYLVMGVFGGWIATLGPDQAALAAYLTMLRNGFNLYCQFGGYSDVAIGFALLLGYRVMENFHWPFLKKNISEFWRSWHISLTSWVREYVYMVVFATLRRPALAALSSMIVLGLWHEISFRYVVWGAYHGAGIVVWQAVQRLRRRGPEVTNVWARRALDAGSILLTFHFVMFGFALVHEPDLGAAMRAWGLVLFWWL